MGGSVLPYPRGKGCRKAGQIKAMAKEGNRADLRYVDEAGHYQLRAEERQIGFGLVFASASLVRAGGEAEQPALFGGSIEGAGGDPVQSCRKMCSHVSGSA